MKKIVTLCAALMVCGASMAFAAGGLNLHFNGCAADGGVSSATFACDVNTGSDVLIASVVLPANMPLFLGTSALVDITVDAPALTSWWQTGAGQCRANALSMSFDPNTFGGTLCADIWGGATPLSVFQLQQNLHGPNHVRMNGGAAIPAGSELSLIADGSELNVCRVSINHTKTTGAGNCDGCSVGACIILSECYLQQPVPNPQYRLSTPISNFVTYNAGPSSCLGAVPTQNRTWGAVKNLYR